MSSPTRLIAFAAAMIGVFLLAMGLGKALGPTKNTEPDKLADYKLVLPDAGFTAGKHELAFRIEREGKPVTSYDTVHEKKLHLIAVRTDDFGGFQHLHPTLSDDGTWRASVSFLPGAWHVYADFTPTGGKPLVLTGPIGVDGPATGVPPIRQTTVRQASVDGYQVKLGGSLDDGKLTPTITRGGTQITPEPYLGAQGHLVVIRHESFDYLHVHPSGATYEVTAGQPGTYELFLQFKHGGVVHTAQFTQETAAEPDAEPTGMGHDHEH